MDAMPLTHPFGKCLSLAGTSSDAEEAAACYRLAVMLRPEKKNGYLGLIDSLSQNDALSEEKGERILLALHAVEYDRKQSNEENLKAWPEEYLPVAYKLGTALYGKNLQNKACVQKLLEDVAEADMETLNLQEYDDEKNLWKTECRNLLNAS